MRILFTKGRNPISFLIRKLTGEPVSHVAFCFDDAMVMHINLAGFHIETIEKFEKKAKIVLEVERDITTFDEELVYQKLLPLRHVKYDYGAFLYWGLRTFLRRSFRVPMPNKNKWAAKSKLWCIELAEGLRPQLVIAPDVKLDAITPYQFYKILKGIE